MRAVWRDRGERASFVLWLSENLQDHSVIRMAGCGGYCDRENISRLVM